MPFSVSRVAVIGAGPSGLAATKHLLSRPSVFSHVVVYEQQPRVGGVWNYDGKAVPQESLDTAWSSPMYDELHANIPASLMEFADCPFPRGGVLFPDREVIRMYVEAYADPSVRDRVRLGCTVSRVSRVDNGDDGDDDDDKWDVEVVELSTGSRTRDRFDAVVVANGHYAQPHVPPIPGLGEFQARHPLAVMHSRSYRSAKSFGQCTSVVVVGNGPSGLDIARQISTSTRTRVYLSVRTATAPEKLAHARCEEIAEIAAFLPDTRGVRLVDGVEMHDVGAVVLCTGYRYAFPFFSAADDDDDDELSKLLTPTGRAVHGIYRHVFHHNHPTLAFLGLLTSVVPFPLAEAQAAVVAGVWANETALADKQMRTAWCDALERERGETLDRCRLGEDGAYLNGLHEWWAQGKDVCGRESKNRTYPGKGKKPPWWNARKLWERSVCYEAKMRFEDGGCTATTLEELGLRME